MRIMYQIFSWNVGGIERQLIDMCNALAKQNHDIYLCIINHDYTDSLLQALSTKIRIIFLERPVGSSSLTYALRFAFIVRKYKIQILHCQGINCVLFSGIAKLFHPSLKVLNTVHDSGNYPSYSAAKIALQNIICSRTIAISDYVRSEILSRNISADKVLTIHNAVDTKRFTYTPALRTSGNIVICNVARFIPAKKGQDTLIKAIELLKNNHPDLYANLHCLFAGGTANGQEDVLQSLQNYVSKHHLSKNISFMGNIEDIPSLLDQIDIFVLPSNYEGFGISLVEALCKGIPCIASNLQGPAEIFRRAEEAGIAIGQLATPGDPRSFADAIDYIITNYDTYDRHAISQYATSTYSMDTFVQEHIQLYNDLLCTHKYLP